MAGLGSPNLDCRQDGARLDGPRGSYLFNTDDRRHRTGRRHPADRHQSALGSAAAERPHPQALPARPLRRSPASARVVDLTYPVEQSGRRPATLRELVDGKHRLRRDAQGRQEPDDHRRLGALARADGAAVLALAARARRQAAALVRDDWNGFNVLHTAAARVGGLDLGFVPGAGRHATSPASWPAARRARSTSSTCWAPTRSIRSELGKAFVIYQGHHGDAGAHRADVVLPGAAYTEKHGTYVNTEGRVQLARRAAFPPGDAREDWAILRALSRAPGQDPAVRHARPGARRGWSPSTSTLRRASTSRLPGDWGSFGAPGSRSRRAVRLADRELLHDRPDQPRRPRTMAECTARRRAADGARRRE